LVRNWKFCWMNIYLLVSI